MINGQAYSGAARPSSPSNPPPPRSLHMTTFTPKWLLSRRGKYCDYTRTLLKYPTLFLATLLVYLSTSICLRQLSTQVLRWAAYSMYVRWWLGC